MPENQQKYKLGTQNLNAFDVLILLVLGKVFVKIVAHQ